MSKCHICWKSHVSAQVSKSCVLADIYQTDKEMQIYVLTYTQTFADTFTQLYDDKAQSVRNSPQNHFIHLTESRKI